MAVGGEGTGINPDTWKKTDVRKLKREFNDRHGIQNPRTGSKLTPAQKAQRTRQRNDKKRRPDDLHPVIPRLRGPRIPIGSIVEAVKPYADYYGVTPYQLATDAATKIVYKYPSLALVLRVWNANPNQQKKKMSLDWIVEYVGMERDEFKALIMTVIRNEAVEKAQDLQILNLAQITEASITFAKEGTTQAASNERIKHLEKHRILDAPKVGGVTVTTQVNQQSASLPSMDDWSRQLDNATRNEQKQLPEADLTNVIDAEVFSEERETVPA